jgi:urease alpha subunit
LRDGVLSMYSSDSQAMGRIGGSCNSYLADGRQNEKDEGDFLLSRIENEHSEIIKIVNENLDQTA